MHSFLWLSNIPLCICTTLLYPFICQWTSRLLPCSAAAAKSLQSCPTLCDPIDGSPPGSPVPGILQARTLEWVCYFFLQCMQVKSEREVRSSVWGTFKWRRKWQPTPVFLPGESQGLGSLVGCHLWGRTELDTTEVI